MALIIQFYQAAELEMDEAFIYYEQQLQGLGERFVAAVEDTYADKGFSRSAWFI